MCVLCTKLSSVYFVCCAALDEVVLMCLCLALCVCVRVASVLLSICN